MNVIIQVGLSDTPTATYCININNKITYIQGDSGTGKTTIVDYINLSYSDDMVRVISEYPVRTLNVADKEIPTDIKNSIIVVDENSPIFRSSSLGSMVKRSKNFFVFISREFKEINVQLATNSFYNLKETSQHYYETVPKYIKPICNLNSISTLNALITEDEKSGAQFIKKIRNFPISISSKGICDLINTLSNYYVSKEFKPKTVLIEYDLLAAGWVQPLIDTYIEEMQASEISWESFESYILLVLDNYPKITLDMLTQYTKEIYLTDTLANIYKNYTKKKLVSTFDPQLHPELIKFGLEKLLKDNSTINQDKGKTNLFSN